MIHAGCIAVTLFLFSLFSSCLGWGGRHHRLPPYITRRNRANRFDKWYVRGINGTSKLLALTETKLKEKGEVSWCGDSGIIADFQEMERTREGVAILLNAVWHSAVIDFGCVSSRILWSKFKFSRVKVCVVVVVVGYGPNEGDGEEREKFWNDLDRIVDRIGNGYRLGILGDLNDWR